MMSFPHPPFDWCFVGIMSAHQRCRSTASVDGVGRRRRGGGEGGGSVTRCGSGKPSQQWLMGLWCVAGDELPTPPLRSVHRWNYVCTPPASVDGVSRQCRSTASRGRGEGGSVTSCGLGEPSQQWLMGLCWQWCVAGDELPTPPLRLVLCWNYVCTPPASVDGVSRQCRSTASRGRGEGGSVTSCGLGEPSQQWLMGLCWQWCVAGDELPTPPLRLVLCWNYVCTPTASVDGVEGAGSRRVGRGLSDAMRFGRAITTVAYGPLVRGG